MKKSWARRFARAVLFLIVGAVVLLIFALIEEHVRGRVMLNRWVKEMSARGEKFTLDELVPESPPAESNAAPYLATILVPGSVIPQQMPPWRFAAPGKAASVVHFGAWHLFGNRVVFTTNWIAATNTTRTTNAMARRGGPGSFGRNQLTNRFDARDLAADLAAASNTLATIHFGLSKPRVDFAIDYRGGFSTLLPHLPQERAIVQWLRGASLHGLLSTNLDQTAEHLSDITRAVHLSTNQVLMIEHLVRFSMLQIGVSATWEALQVDGWTDAQLAALQTGWQMDSSAHWLARAFEVERVMGAQEIDRIASIGPSVLAAWTGNPPPAPSPPIRTLDDFFEALSELPKQMEPLFMSAIYFPLWKFAWKDQEKLFLYKVWQQQIEAARAQAKEPNWHKHKIREWGEDSARFDPRRLVTRVIGMFTGRTISRTVQADAAAALTCTSIALKRFELKHGRLPSSLHELVPEFLAKVPIDPSDGEPLRYQAKEGHAFTLYSMGENLRDDHGNAAQTNSSAQPNFLNGADVVWPQRATRAEVEAFERKNR